MSTLPTQYPIEIDGRHADILKIIRMRPGLSQGELAKVSECPPRSLRRHLKALNQEGLIYIRPCGNSKQYFIADDAQVRLPKSGLSEAEAETLFVATLAAQSLLRPTPMHDILQSVQQKLRLSWIEEVFAFEPGHDDENWSFDGATGGQSAHIDAGIFRSLIDAVRNSNPVITEYFTAYRNTTTSDRKLTPYGFFVRSGTWMLVALDHNSSEIRDFSLTGFRSILLVENEVDPRPDGFDLQLHARDRFGAISDGNVETVRLLVEPEAIPYFERKEYSPTQQIEERLETGQAVVSYEVEGLVSVAAFVRSWGPLVRALEPPELVHLVAETLKQAAGQYA